jgi:hypothetical protein
MMPWRAAAVVLLATGASGCALWTTSFSTVESQLAAQRFDAALETLERIGSSRTDEALFLLNKAMLQRMNGQFSASNDTFETAKQRMDELSAVSLTETTLAFLINDATKSYAGEEYEQVLVHLYQALNYLELGRLDEARVEALQVDEKLKSVSGRIAKNIYTDDALARYLTGLLYEDNREWSDALIAYRKAYEAYRQYAKVFNVGVPAVLQHDLVRLTEHLGLTEENAQYKKEFGIERTPSVVERAALGELVFVLHNGQAPVKREHAVHAPDFKTGLLVRVSLPYYAQQRPGASGARVTLVPDSNPGTPPYQAQTELMENIDAIARNNLESKLPAITARAVTRAVAKTAAAHAAARGAQRGGDKNAALAGALIGTGIGLIGVLTERADTRSWQTLPHDIQLARIALPPGKYDVKVDLLEGGRAVPVLRQQSVTLDAGRKRYLSFHHVSATAVSGNWR